VTRSTLEARAEVVDGVGGLDRDEWTDLCRRSGAPAFYGHDFLTAYEACPLQPTERVLYVTVRTPGGDLVAGTPAYVQPVADSFGVLAAALGRPVERVLLTHVSHCYDTWVPALRLDAETVGLIWRTIADLAAEHRVDAFGFANVRASGPLAGALRSVGEGLTPGAPRYRLGLSALPGVEAYLRLLGPSTRKTMRRYVRRAAAAGVTATWSSGSDGEVDDVLSLCEVTARKRAPGYYVPRALAALLRRLGEGCRILRLRLDGRTLAASICLLDDRRFHTWAGGSLYPAELGFSPQYVLFFEEVRAALGSGRSVLEGGRRNDEFKGRHGLRPIPLVACIADAGRRGRPGGTR
jgi:predicted N-acyltransferase